MKAIQQLERLKRMNEMIKAECTGSPREFSRKLGISQSHLYRIIEELKFYGLPIVYSKTKRSYRYEGKNIELKLDYSIKIIDGETTRKIFGGHSIHNHPLLFFESVPTYFSI